MRGSSLGDDAARTATWAARVIARGRMRGTGLMPAHIVPGLMEIRDWRLEIGRCQSPISNLQSPKKGVERICKPNPVPRTFVRGEDHSSATRVAAVVEQPTRKLSAETGGSTASLFGLAPQGVCHAVAAHAGRGALLPHRFTLTSTHLTCARCAGRRFFFCCTFRRVAAPGRYPACCPSEFGLSSTLRWRSSDPLHTRTSITGNGAVCSPSRLRNSFS